MENATEALLMAFAVFIFVIALTVSIVAFGNAKDAADFILYTKDETNYYEYMGSTGKADENRIIGLETIIPTLYKYYKENYTVVFKEGNYNKTTGQISNWKYMPVYITTANRNWQLSYKNLMKNKYDEDVDLASSKDIFSFDLDEETLRHEPWTGSYDRAKNNLDCFLNGETYINPNNNTPYISYSGFVSQYKDKKFIETITEYKPTGIADENEEGKHSGSLTKEKSKRMIIFTKINNLEE